MLFRRIIRWLAVAGLVLAWPTQGAAAVISPIRVVVSFSILQDIVQEVGGGDVAVTSLIGPDSDAHVFEPRPDQARLLSHAQLFVVNGFGFEGWLARLTGSAQYRGPVVVATAGITPITRTGSGEAAPSPDPHAWQDAHNAVIYADNIARALAGADPARANAYRQRLREYKAKIEALDRHVRDELGAIPAEKRRVITSHDAFGYFAEAYGIAFIAPLGVSTETEPSARDIAGIIGQIKQAKIPAVFLENMSDDRLIGRIAAESGAKLGGTLYSDALTSEKGDAPTYIAMVKHNITALTSALDR